MSTKNQNQNQKLSANTSKLISSVAFSTPELPRRILLNLKASYRSTEIPSYQDTELPSYQDTEGVSDESGEKASYRSTKLPSYQATEGVSDKSEEEASYRATALLRK